MYLLYLDASGNPELSDTNSKHYVLRGVCMKESSWFTLDRRLRGLNKRYQYFEHEFELHVKQFACTIKEQQQVTNFESLSWSDRWDQVESIRDMKLAAEKDPKARQARKDRYAETANFIHLSRAERSALLEEAVQILATHTGIKLFAEAISKSTPSITSGRVKPTLQAFEQVASRFDAYLSAIGERRTRANPRARIDYGLLILDHDKSTERTIESTFKKFREQGHSFGSLRNVIDVPFFASSEKVSGLQIVDVASYVIRRYLDTGAVPGSHEERLFQSIFPQFDRDNTGRLHGLRHYTSSGSCSCLICRERGHSAP